MNSTHYERFSIKNVPMSITWIFLIIFLSLAYDPLAHGVETYFSIALSKFSNERDAKKEEAKLKNSGHNAFYREEKNPGNKGTEYQVYIEKYNSKDEAEQEAKVLKDLDLISDYTVRKVIEIPVIDPKKAISTEETKNEESPPIPQPTKDKEQSPEQIVGTENQTTQSKLSPAVKKPEPGTEQLPIPNKTELKSEKPSVVQKPESNTTLPLSEKKTEPDPAPKVKPKAVQKKKIAEPEPVINYDDAQLNEASLQVGAFKDEANAADLELKLRNLGKNAFYRHESADSKGEFYRLYITGYASLRDAINDAKTLLKSGVISGYSRVHSKYPPPDDISKKSEKKEKKGKIYFIHISSNKNEANAAEAVARLKKSGYKAFYVFDKDPADSWYRVYIGEFKDEAEAREKGMELFKKGIIPYFKPLAIDKEDLDK